MRVLRTLCLSACWAVMASALSADPLSELPPAWSGRLLPVPEQSLGALDPSAVARLQDARAGLAKSLSNDEASVSDPVADLALGYGRLGGLYAADRLWSAARLAFDNAMRLDPGDFRWAYYGAHLALDAGDVEPALQRLEEARRLDPDYPTLSLRRGEALLGLSRLDEAEGAYSAALEKQPEQRAAALYGLAQIDLLQRRWPSAAERLTEVLRLQPGSTAAHYGLGQALLRLGKREEAQDHLAQRGTVKPGYPDALVEELAALKSGARHHFEQAMLAVNAEDYEAALTAFAAGLAEEPDNARARTSYARALWLAGRHEQAIEQLRLSEQNDRKETLPSFLLAAIADGEDRIEAAERGYRAVLERDPAHLGALSYMADLALRSGDAEAAAEWYRRAIEVDANQPALRVLYWRALLESGATQARLRDALERFDHRFPEPPMFRALLARLLATSPDPQVRDTERALQLAADLINAIPIAPHQELLALTLAARGEWGQAVERQSLLVERARQSGAGKFAELLAADLHAYDAHRLPERIWRLDQGLFQPAGVDVTRLMQNYPAARPY